MIRLAILAVLSAAIVLAPRSPATAEPAGGFRVIVNPANPVDKLDRRVVSDAFLKKRTRWEDDRAIQPVDLGQRTSVRGAFSREVLGRDVASVRRYWAQLVFSGRGVPPPELATDGDVVKFVAAHGGAIGYVAAGAALAGVKVVEVD
jgi:ABC-type phosphate transport system substrate-binding protein